MKILITGLPGTGKSTISKALREKGVLSIDFSDVSGMCFWQNKETKEKLKYSPIQTREWFEFNERICDLEKLKEMLNQHENIIMTGLAMGNQKEYLPLFDKVILLRCSPNVIVYRMQTRVAPYGKTKTERDEAIGKQKEFDDLILSCGAIPINNDGPISAVIDNIISKL
ncbi:MAG TPA: AAA family ATPase [Candidatus Paceibacterota bacterium]